MGEIMKEQETQVNVWMEIKKKFKERKGTLIGEMIRIYRNQAIKQAGNY